MGKIIGLLSTLFVYFCIATVFAQVIVVGYALGTGTIDNGKLDKMLAIAHGAEMVALDAAGSAKQSGSGEMQDQASLEYVDLLKSMKWRAFEMRENNLLNMMTELKRLKGELETKRDDYSHIIASAMEDLEKQRKEELGEAKRDFEEIYAGMKPKQAKQQLLMDIEDGKIASVVDVLAGMEKSRRDRIIAEFKSQEEADILHKILNRVRNPDVAIYDKAIQKIRAGNPDN